MTNEGVLISSDIPIMAISFWKCLEKKGSRVKFRQRIQNIQIKKIKKYQNSYHLESSKPFSVDPVDKIVKSVMEYRLEDVVYDGATVSELCCSTAGEIRKKIITNLNFDRYKTVVIVTIMEKMSQAIETNMGFLCDVDKDDYTIYTMESETFIAYCIVIGIYHE